MEFTASHPDQASREREGASSTLASLLALSDTRRALLAFKGEKTGSGRTSLGDELFGEAPDRSRLGAIHEVESQFLHAHRLIGRNALADRLRATNEH